MAMIICFIILLTHIVSSRHSEKYLKITNQNRLLPPLDSYKSQI